MTRPPATIAYVMTHYPRVTQTFIAAEIAALEEAGHTVVPIAANPATGVDAASPEVARTLYLKSVPKRRALQVMASAAARHPLAFLRLMRLAQAGAGTDAGRLAKRSFHLAEAVLIWRHAVDHGVTQLHAHFAQTPSTLAMLAAEFARTTGEGPTRWTYTTHSASELFDDQWGLTRRKARSADAIICVSDATRSHLMRTSDPETWDRQLVVRCGVDLDRFPFREPPPLQDPPVVAVVGRLAPEKGHLVLVEAAAQLRRQGRPVRLRIIGEGPMRPLIADAAQAQGIADLVDLVGELAPHEVRPQLLTADAFCLPSFDEGLPIAIMEAMASGVPVVSTYVAGIPELAVDRDTAMVVPPGNPDALAEAIGTLIGDDELRSSIVHRARTAVEKHHDARVTLDEFERALLDPLPR